MTLQEYYNKILEKIENNEYKVVRKSHDIPLPEIETKHNHNEAINYMIYEYMEDHKDKRRFLIFDYVLKPNGIGNKTRESENNFDFTSITFEEFFDFMVTIK